MGRRAALVGRERLAGALRDSSRRSGQAAAGEVVEGESSASTSCARDPQWTDDSSFLARASSRAFAYLATSSALGRM